MKPLCVKYGVRSKGGCDTLPTVEPRPAWLLFVPGSWKSDAWLRLFLNVGCGVVVLLGCLRMLVPRCARLPRRAWHYELVRAQVDCVVRRALARRACHHTFEHPLRRFFGEIRAACEMAPVSGVDCDGLFDAAHRNREHGSASLNGSAVRPHAGWVHGRRNPLDISNPGLGREGG